VSCRRAEPPASIRWTCCVTSSLGSAAFDLRLAWRRTAASPGFALAAVLSLGLGIGAVTTLASLVQAVLLRPLPVAEPERVVAVYTSDYSGPAHGGSSYPDYLDFRGRNSVFSDVMGYSPSIAAVKTGDRSRMALGEVVTGNYFQVLGVGAALGRTLLPEDDRPGAPRVAMLSHRAWLREYARDPGVLGRTLLIHGQPYTVVGVSPESFTGMLPMLQPELWTPAAWVEEIEPAGIQDVVPSPATRASSVADSGGCS